MPISYTYKRQGDGRDSWIAVETNSLGVVINKYLVYEDPNKKEAVRDFEKLSETDITTIKQIIGVTGGGAQGATGAQGTVGATGAQGTTGAQGITGAAGTHYGNAGIWIYEGVTLTPSAASTNKFKANIGGGNRLNSIGILYISATSNNVDFVSWFNGMSSGRSIVTISEVGNSSVFATFTTNAIANNSGYWTIGVDRIYTSSGVLTVGASYVVSFVNNGWDGAQGTTGTQGATGPSGINGSNGAQGITGETGPAGANGLDGAPGPRGPQGPPGTGGTITADAGIIVTQVEAGYTIGVDFDAIGGGGNTKGYTGTVQVSDGKYINLLDFQNGLLVNVTQRG